MNTRAKTGTPVKARARGNAAGTFGYSHANPSRAKSTATGVRYVCAVERPAHVPWYDRKPKRERVLRGDDQGIFLFPDVGQGRLNLRDAEDRIAAARQAEHPVDSLDALGIRRHLRYVDTRAARVVRMARKRRRGWA